MSMCLALFLLLAQDDRRPVPDAAAQKEAEKMVKDVYKAEYAKTATADRQDLAKKLLDQGIETADDFNLKFVLLREARDVGAQAGDVETAIFAIEHMAKTYTVDTIPMRLAALNSAGKVAKPDTSRTFAEWYLRLAEDAATADDYDTASQAAASAVSFAKKVKDADLTARTEKKSKVILDHKARFEKVRKARDTLAKTPDDPASNLAMGQFRCGVKNDFERGLPLLAKAKEGSWKIAADRELGDVASPGNQAAAGDAWFDIAEKETGVVRDNLRSRALGWYTKAEKGATGIGKTKIAKRIGELRADRIKGEYENLGQAGESIRCVAPGARATCTVESIPSGEFNGVSAVMTVDNVGKVTGSLIFERFACAVAVDVGVGEAQAYRQNNKEWILQFKEPVEKKKEYVLVVVIIEGEYCLFVDGVLKLRLATSATTIDALSFQADDAPVTFSKLRLRRKE